MWQILIGFIMLSCGIALTITVISMNMVGVGSTMDFIYCGVLLIFGAVCTLIDYDYIQFIFNNAGFVNDVDFLSQIFICAFIIMYMRTFIENKNMKKVVMMVATLMGASVPVCLSMRNFGLCMLNDFVWVLIPVFIVLIIATGFVLVAEYLKNRNKRTLVILQSTIVVAVFAVAEMLRFFLFGEYWIVLFQIGLLYFTVTQFYYLLKITGETIIMARNAERAQRELTEVKTQIMLSQIQPHFLYNALASIAQLCRKDPKQAEKTTVDFAKYLRLNLDSLENNRPVPFETELKHIETYLNIEQLRFGEKLKTRYDIQTKDFRLPALTVQPLVENAVKHGIFAKESGGTIVISSLEDEHSYIILVSDDGCGFVPGRPPEDGRNHIGLENVKNRLSAICGGTLEIESEPGEGTTATVRIPKLD